MLNLNVIEISLASSIFVLFIWLIILTFQLVSMKSHYANLIKDSSKKDLKSLLEGIIDKLDLQEKDLKKIYDNIGQLEHTTSFHLQNISFKRFNPFQETGGNQSFILALMDKHKNGMVLSSLHSRDVTRIYAKQLIKGNPIDSELSDEEKDTVANARRFER